MFHQPTWVSTKNERELSQKRYTQGFHPVKGESENYPENYPTYRGDTKKGYVNAYDLVWANGVIDLKNTPQSRMGESFRIELASSPKAFEPKKELLEERKWHYVIECF